MLRWPKLLKIEVVGPKEEDMLNKVITTNEMWARAFELQLK
jgi:hypothetical protein